MAEAGRDELFAGEIGGFDESIEVGMLQMSEIRSRIQPVSRFVETDGHPSNYEGSKLQPGDIGVMFTSWLDGKFPCGALLPIGGLRADST